LGSGGSSGGDETESEKGFFGYIIMSELKQHNGFWEWVHEYPHIYYYIERRFAFWNTCHRCMIIIKDYSYVKKSFWVFV